MAVAHPLVVGAVQGIGYKRLAKPTRPRRHKLHDRAGNLRHVLHLKLGKAVGACAATIALCGQGLAGTQLRARPRIRQCALVPKIAEHVLAQAPGSLAVALHLAQKTVTVLAGALKLLLVKVGTRQAVLPPYHGSSLSRTGAV